MKDQKRQPKQYKVDEVTKLKEKLGAAKSSIFVNYAGMGVKAQQDLKKKLKENGSTMLVAKNTFLKIAAQQSEFPEEVLTDTVLTGQTAVVISTEDAVAPVQILGKYIADNELPKMKAGVVEGKFYDEANLQKLAKLPGREVLYAQVVGGVAAPMYGLVGTLQGNLQKLVYMLDQYKNDLQSKNSKS